MLFEQWPRTSKSQIKPNETEGFQESKVTMVMNTKMTSMIELHFQPFFEVIAKDKSIALFDPVCKLKQIGNYSANQLF